MAITTQSESKARLATLKKLLEEDTVSTQEELCEALLKKNFSVTQSTISRDLRRIGAIKTVSAAGSVVYRLPEEQMLLSPSLTAGLKARAGDHRRAGNPKLRRLLEAGHRLRRGEEDQSVPRTFELARRQPSDEGTSRLLRR